jgi:hypothetical protein
MHISFFYFTSPSYHPPHLHHYIRFYSLLQFSFPLRPLSFLSSFYCIMSSPSFSWPHPLTYFLLTFSLGIHLTGPPLWSSGQSSWLQIQRSSFDSQRYQISREVVSLERGPLSLVSTIDELLGRKSSGSGLENREYGRRDPSHWPRGTLYPQKLALTSPASGGRSVGIVSSRTQATVFLYTLRSIPVAGINTRTTANRLRCLHAVQYRIQQSVCYVVTRNV